MKVAEAIADHLVSLGVTDVFGIPGGVVLELLYAFKDRSGLEPHLSYHEQCAGFAACGYAQAGGKLGVAYATRGPGFTNLITPIADAFCDSLPVLFIVAHSELVPPSGMRVMSDQELDTCSIVRNVTKFAARIDTIQEFVELFPTACGLAQSGRKGPVLLDFSARLLKEDFPGEISCASFSSQLDDPEGVAEELSMTVSGADRPVILVGDGIKQSGSSDLFRSFFERASVPVVSSRFSHDVAGGCENYFGYVGSHGVRVANFILSKTDLIVSIGNRLHVPMQSKSFSPIWEHARLLRLEVDENEFQREIPNARNFHVDAASVLKQLGRKGTQCFGVHEKWLDVCRTLRDSLWETDCNEAVLKLAEILSAISDDVIVVNDVGNNEFFVSRASVYAGARNRTLYSKSLGALGCSLGKSIGAYYATLKPVVCFVGDQGLAMNVQELQFIAQHRLPIIVVVVDNGISGMIRDKEMKMFGMPLHATRETGYAALNLLKVADAFGLEYAESIDFEHGEQWMSKGPMIVRCAIPADVSLIPDLPCGHACTNMWPPISGDLHSRLKDL